MSPGRSRNALQTRADILDAARRRFGSEGYQATTLRGVASDVGVDPALIIRYFGNKQNLFAEAAEFTLELPDLTEVDEGDVADVLLSRFFAVWEKDTTFLALLRAAMTSESAAETMRRVFATQVAPAVAAVTPDHPAQRAGMLGAFVIGLATTRYVMANPAVANLSHDELIRFARPVIVQVLFGSISPPADAESEDMHEGRPKSGT